MAKTRLFALAAAAVVGTIGLIGLANDSINTRGNFRRLGINHPFAPYSGPLEPRRQLKSTFKVQGDGSVTCTFGATKGPSEITDEMGASFDNTIVVGYPGADKRLVLRQMEAMTGLSGVDSWDFKFKWEGKPLNANGYVTNQPYVKTNYPHHEGIWGWGAHGDQVILVIRNIRRTIDDYHDILADIDYAKTWEEATDKIPRLYKGEIYDDMYSRWRDERTMDEIGWYGWLIDYWMEGGILRDYFDHKLTTKEHWALLRKPETYTYGELQWDVNN